MTEAHLLDGVVLPNLGGDFLYNWAVFHLGEMLLLTDWAISTSGPSLQIRSNHQHKVWQGVSKPSWLATKHLYKQATAPHNAGAHKAQVHTKLKCAGLLTD